MIALVTGATGFVGAAVVRRLLAAALQVRVLVRAGSARDNLDGLAVEVVVGDLTAPETLRPALRGCQALFHVAADYRLWVRDPGAMYATNVHGTVALMHAARDCHVERIVYTSSVATLGHATAEHPADEDTPVTLADMIGPYKRSKFLAEAEVRRLAEHARLPVVIVNPTTPVGPGDLRPTPTGRFILQAARGRMPAYVDTGLNVVHVDDVADGHWRAFQRGRPGERYVLGGENLTLRAILERLAAITGRRPPRLRLPRTPLYPLAYAAEAWARLRGRGPPLLTVDELRMAARHMFFNSGKAARELGYAPRPAEQALEDAVRWYREHGYLAR